jgi:hypothetical protein
MIPDPPAPPAARLEESAMNEYDPIANPPEPSDDVILAWVARQRMLSELHFDRNYEAQRISQYRRDWRCSHTEQPRAAADQRVTPAEQKLKENETPSQDARVARQPLVEHGDLPRPSSVVSEQGLPEKK